ncbi:synaptobrevin [Gigaspora margarita]|uniref:Synaptobrevin n=1 Tax=Gigaspora margarita TaxID=4874 RepID=A0A8H3ZZV0_GIGMA|nr:synaptobrevin [Gigaspora margarita]
MFIIEIISSIGDQYTSITMSDNNEKAYDPYGARSSSQESGTPKLQHVQEQIDTTKDEIQSSLIAMAKRGEKLGELEEKTAMLQETSSVFKLQTAKTRKKLWWKDAKMTVILTVVALIILAVIIVPIVLKAQNKI